MKRKPKDKLFEFWIAPLTPAKRKEEFQKIVRKMTAEGATTREIGEYLGCSAANITMTYHRELQEGRLELAMSVRSWQITKGRMGDTEMLKTLGRIYCPDQRNLDADTLNKEDITASIDAICGNSAQNNPTTLETLPTDSMLPSDPSDPVNL